MDRLPVYGALGFFFSMFAIRGASATSRYEHCAPAGGRPMDGIFWRVRGFLTSSEETPLSRTRNMLQKVCLTVLERNRDNINSINRQ